jgi:ethanolamine utilization protein EutA (predicted chaperonin)
MSHSRKLVRETFASLLASTMSAVQTVHDHEPGDLGSASPVVVVSVASERRGPMTFEGRRLTLVLNVDIYTLAAEGNGGGYTYADSADVIDTCAEQLADVIDANQQNSKASWEAIDYAGQSIIEFGIFNDDGIPRYRERVPIQIEVY